MTLHEEYNKLRTELYAMERELSYNSPSNALRLDVHPEGIRIETRTPSGTNDIVHTLYLTEVQAKLVATFIERVFDLNRDKLVAEVKELMHAATP